jgi:hypothetical protein
MQVQNLYISMVILLYFEIFNFVMIIFYLSNDLLIYTCVARATLLVCYRGNKNGMTKRAFGSRPKKGWDGMILIMDAFGCK